MGPTDEKRGDGAPPRPDELAGAVDGFAAKLDELAAGLDERDRALLDRLLWRAADPIERAGWRDIDDVLDPDQRAFLAALEGERPQVEQPGIDGVNR